MGTMASREAEAALIGGFLLDWKCVENRKARAVCRPEMLWSPTLRTVYEAMERLDADGFCPDLVSVKDALERSGKLDAAGGVDALVQLAENAVSAKNAAGYARIVKEWHIRRGIRKRCAELAKMAEEGGEVAQLYSRALDLPRGLASETTDTYRMDELDVEGDQALEFVPTWYRTLDARVKGYPRGETTMVMAPTGRGKTCWLAWAAHNAAMAGKTVVFATYEMPAIAIKRRILRHVCGWSHRPTIDLEAAARFDEALETVNDRFYDMEVYDPSSRLDSRYTVEELRDFLIAKAESGPLDLVLVDYYQRLTTERPRGSMAEELAYVSRMLAATAKRCGCAIVCGSQISEEDDGSGGRRSRIRGSREGENDAALILEISADQTMVRVQKARHGESGGQIPVTFDKRRLIFKEVA